MSWSRLSLASWTKDLGKIVRDTIQSLAAGNKIAFILISILLVNIAYPISELGTGAALYTLWWLYFSDTADSLFDLSSNLKLSSWSWGHFFLATSLVAFGVAVKKLFTETINYSDKVVIDEYRLLLTAAVAIFLLALALINYGLDDKLTPHSQIKRVLVYLGVAVGIAGMGLLLTSPTATQFTGIIAVIMVLVVALNIYQSVTFAEPQLEH